MMRRNSTLTSGCAKQSAVLLLLALPWSACSRPPLNKEPSKEIMPRRDINEVLRTHDRELMAIPGVVGVYVGLRADSKTACLKVMVVKKTAELERKIPKSLEGYEVVLEETGIIRPMRGK
jgi:hypothetical protein